MYEQTLSQAGLSKEQALIYEVLIKNGPLPAGKISKKTPLKRGLVYKLLDQLINFGLIEKNEPIGKAAIFSPAHPLKLKELAEKQEQQAKDAQLALEGMLPSIVSDFNLVSGQPGVQFYEGKDGIKKVWWDSLASKTEIYTYGDPNTLTADFVELNKEYLAERKKREIRKKIITNDSEANRKFMQSYDNEYTETRLLKNGAIDFSSTIIEIYDDKISYSTMTKKSIISVLIHDKNIYNMNKNLFEYIWQKLANNN